MEYVAEFTGWKDVTLDDLLISYRKAKADCYFENTFPASIKFANYEEDLVANLQSLLKTIRKGRFPDKWLGSYRVIPKKLSINPKGGKELSHVHFSSPQRAFDNISRFNQLTPEFRVIGDFPVEAHVISALWINCVGHKLDSALSAECYGARLRRVREDGVRASDKKFHIGAIGSFVPYFSPYQKWRSDGLRVMRGELEEGKEIVAASLDLKSYYHHIDPGIITSIRLFDELGVDLSENEKNFCNELASFLLRWSDGASKFCKERIGADAVISGGLVIGLTATRIISNVLLHRWDKLIREKVTPIHYGRYVDDMFIVLRDSGQIRSADDLMGFLQSRMGDSLVKKDGKSSGGGGIWRIFLGKGVQGKGSITIQSNKQKLFVLQGRAGLDLLDSIEKEIRELSSEHRLMPSPDQLEDSTAARVLSAAASASEQADTLRRADGLTIRRLSWSLQLRHVETLGRDLPPSEWVRQRKDFYEFAHNHVLRPDGIFAHFVYLPRLLGFAIRQNDWIEAERIVLAARTALAQLASAVGSGGKVEINGSPAKVSTQLWGCVETAMNWMFVEAAASYYDPNRLLSKERSSREARLAKLFVEGMLKQLSSEEFSSTDFSSADFYKVAPLIAAADLAKDPYKQVLKSASASDLIARRDAKSEKVILNGMARLIDVKALEDFLSSTRVARLAAVAAGKRPESRMPYLFPTRPLSPADIAELAPECVGLPRNDGRVASEYPAATWARYTQALRGVWVKPTLLALSQERGGASSPAKKNGKKKFLLIGTESKKRIVVAVTSVRTDDSDWAAMASGRPNHSLDRYARLSELVNQAIRLDPKPDLVLLPELSLPLRWVSSLSSRLAASGIGLVAGTEYRHTKNGGVYSEACLVLSDNRLGYPTWVRLWQPKLEPAVNEDRDLFTKFGKQWAKSEIKGHRTKPVYIHNGIHYGVMVCSELQNGKARMAFQGNIDALFVLSWNQDLDTFSALVEAAALDMHAYVILVNNRKYGDSRVRAPAKESFMRDVARLRGGENDFVVAAALNVDELRAFQSRAKRWPEKGDQFKPVPEGYVLRGSRRRSPPG